MTLQAAQERHKNSGRNDICPCGSAKKYKKCHLAEDDKAITEELTRVAAAAQAKADAQAAEEAAAAEAAGEGNKSASSQPAKAGTGGASQRGGTGSYPGSKDGKGEKSKSLSRRAAV